MLLDKDSVVQILQSAMDQVNALADQSGANQQAEIDALKAEVEQKKSEIEGLNLQVGSLMSANDEKAAKLAEVNALAKQIDESIPD